MPISYTCAHCERPCSGVIALQIHACNSQVNVLCGAHFFCSAECRSDWYDTPTTEDIVPVLRPPAECLASLNKRIKLCSGFTKHELNAINTMVSDPISAIQHSAKIGVTTLRVEPNGTISSNDPEIVQHGFAPNTFVDVIDVWPAVRNKIVNYLHEKSRKTHGVDSHEHLAIKDLADAMSGNLHADHGPLEVLVLLHDGDPGAVVEVKPNGATTPSVIAGSPHEIHVMESPHHLNKWWRGEVESVPVPFPEEPDPQ